MKIILILIILVSSIYGCGRGAYQERIQGHYWITALDTMDELALMNDSSGYMINIVEPKITQYHSGENCIVVNRKDIKTDAVEFYIIPLRERALHKNEEKNLVGPLDLFLLKTEFNRLCDEQLEFKSIE